MGDECIHEMARGTCALCKETSSRGRTTTVVPGTFRRGAAPFENDRQPVSRGPIAARYPGFCRECRHEVSVGESISPNHDDEWVHTECL